MRGVLDKSHAEAIWGQEEVKKYFKEESTVKYDIQDKKIIYVKKVTKTLFIRPFVKMIGISGSVASGLYKEGEDTDIFVVVNNHFSWIFRGLAKLILGSNVIWYEDNDKKNRICLNFILEERGLYFKEEDIFTFHEIFYLIPIWGEDYFPYLLNKNVWVYTEFFAKKRDINKERYLLMDVLLAILFCIPNFIAFILQVMYMLILKHKPDLKRLWNTYLEGKIEFYLDDFRKTKVKDFLDKYKK